MLNASATSPVVSSLTVVDGSVRCNHTITKFGGGERQCGHKLIDHEEIVCDNGRCKSSGHQGRHNIYDVATAQVNGSEEAFDLVRRKFLLSFWERSAISAMTDYYEGQRHIDSWPEWMRRRVDLIDNKRFCPVWLSNFWTLIERQTSAVSPRELGTKDRSATQPELMVLIERFAQATDIRPSKIYLPEDLSMLRKIQDMRRFLSVRQGWANDNDWRDDDWYWTSFGWMGMACVQQNLEHRGPQNTPSQDARAKFQVVIHG